MPLFTKKHRERTDNKKSFEKICPCESILTGNAFFREVDDRTRADIRRSLYRYANLHRLTLSEAASVLASHPDCMYKGKYAPYLRKEINTDPGERLPKVYMIFPESEAGSIEKKIAYLTRISHESQIGIIVVPSPSPTVFCKRDSDFAAFLSELYNRLNGRFGVSFEISVPTRGFDISKHVYRCPEDSDSLLYRALTETDIGIKLGGGERPPSSVILLGRNVSLSVDCVNILTRAAALERRRKGQNLVISALTEYYIPQRHTLFSAISCKYRSDAEHGASIINVPGFIAAYEKRSALPRAAVCRGAIAFVKKEHSPVRELSRLAAGEKTGLRRITTSPARLIWDTTCRLFPLFTLITLMITGTLYGRTAAVFLTVSLLLYSFYTCRGMVFVSFISAYPAVKAFLRALLAVIIRYLYYITLLPSLFAACLYGEVSYISKGHDERAVNKTPGSALTFFALSVISLVFGVIALAFAKSFFLRAFALSVTLCPLFTVLLSLERGEKRVSVSKLILTHAKRSYKTFRDFYEKKSPRLCEGEGILLEEGEFTPSDLGLSLAAYLAYHDLEIISLSELYSRLSDLFSILEGLTASDGLFYGSYRLSDRAAGVRTRISKEENGILLCCLIALREGLADLILPGDILLKRCEALIKRADLSLLSDPKINITGYGLLSDLLAFCSLQDKETTSGAYFAKKGVALTDGGSLDQLLLPYLFLPLFPYTQAAVGIRKHIIKNRRKAFRGMWGYTLSSSPEMDFLGEHIIKPDNGMPELAVYDGSKAGYISPYACFLTLGIRPVSSLLCLMKYSSHGMLGQGGFYDSLIPGENGLPFRIVRAYSLHNIAVSVIASANFQRGGIFIKRFCSSELIFPCLYRLRTKRIPIAGRSAQPLPVAKEEDLLESGDFGVPRIRLITNGIISLAASSEGHIWLFSKERDLTCFPFNPGDMGDISSSFSVLWSADGICRDAVGGRFLSDSDGALYIKNDGESVSFLKFTLSPDSGECRMTLTGKGNFDDSGIALSFKSGMSAKAGADGLYISSGDSLFYVSCLSEGAEYSVEDGLCEICLLKASSGGFFSFDVLFRYTEDCIEYRRVTPIADRSGELTKSAILASYFLCAGGTRDGRGLEREEFTALFPSPTVALFTGAGAENYGMISEISDICRNMRLAGLDITLVICADDINDARLISFAGSEDILIAPDEKLSGLLRAFSVICFEKEDMISPERFLSGVMSASRRAKQYCRGGGTALGGALYTDALPVFSAGDDLLRLVCDEDGVFSLFYLETRIASEMTLSLGLEDGEHDIICSCFFAAHDRSVAVFKGMIDGEMITVGIFSDPEAEAIIIRVFAPRGRVGIDLVPLPDICDPRLVKRIDEGDTSFFRSVLRGELEDIALYTAKVLMPGSETLFLTGITGSDGREYYNALEKYSSPSGCESPIEKSAPLRISGIDRKLDRLINREIPGRFDRCLSPRERIYAFPLLALTDPERLKGEIRGFIESCEPEKSRSLVLPFAIALLYAFEPDDGFLRERVVGKCGVCQSVYLWGYRTIESFEPESDETRYRRNTALGYFNRLCARMNDTPITPSELRGEGLSGIALSCSYFDSGEPEEGFRTLLSLSPDPQSAALPELSLFCFTLIYRLIGIVGNGNGFSVHPEFPGGKRSFILRLARGETGYRISVNGGSGAKVILDGAESENRFRFDGGKHIVEISAPAESE